MGWINIIKDSNLNKIKKKIPKKDIESEKKKKVVFDNNE